MTQRRILVLGEDTQSFLTVIRSLGRAGIEVHVAWCPLDSAALASRYVHTVHNLPAFLPESFAWIEAFQELFRREQFDLVLPTTDSTALPFQIHRVLFEPLTRICLLSDDTYRISSSKDLTWELADGLGIPLPRQRLVSDERDMLAAAADFGYPLVLKPVTSAHKENPLERQKVHKVSDQTELLHLAPVMLTDPPILTQQNFIGIGIGVEVLCKDGRILLAFQHERVHEPLHGGGSSYRKSVPLHPEMLAATTRLMQALKYTGVAMVEYKQDATTGEWVLLEINARFWGSLALSSAAGLDFPLALVELLLDDRETFPQHYRTGIYCRHWSRDLQWLFADVRADKSDPALHTRPLSSVFLEVFHLLALREYSDTFTFSDPRPAWADLRQFFDEKLFNVFKVLRPYRSFQQRKLRRLFSSAKNIIVLCHGNICRSPFALGVLKERFSKPAVSRGAYPRAGRNSLEVAISAAAERGVDLAQHRSAVITLEEFRAADLVLVFDRQNWVALRALDPACMDRVAYLAAADPSQPLEIPDPFGGDLAAFRACYARIERAFARLAGD